jgi:hypothetical protein
VAGNDNVDGREIAEVGRLLRREQGVGGAHYSHDHTDYERGSTRPLGERERKRNDCEDGQWEAGDLPTWRHDARRGTKRALAAAAAAATEAQAQTEAQNAAKTPARAQAKVSPHTHTC